MAQKTVTAAQWTPGRLPLMWKLMGISESLTPVKKRKKMAKIMFIVFLFGAIFINFDGGAIPAALSSIVKDFKTNNFLLGCLGALPYVGITLSSPVMGSFLQKISPKYVIMWSMFFNVVASILCTISLFESMLLFSRFLCGLSQSAFIIYLPVWVNHYAPLKQSALWLGLVQGSTIIGVAIGYSSAGFISQYGRNWRWSFLLQNISLTILVVMMGFFPEEMLLMHVENKDPLLSPETLSTTATPTVAENLTRNTLTEEEAFERTPTSDTEVSTSSSETVFTHCEYNWEATPLQQASRSNEALLHTSQAPTFLQTILILARSPIYIYVITTVCALLFVVTGIQFWSTKYFTDNSSFSPWIITLCFAMTAITAPTCGVTVGGYAIDRAGGYSSPEGMYTSLKICLICSIVGSAVGTCASFVKSFFIIVFCIWLLLFVGGFMLPPLTGILVTCVDPCIRPSVSGFSLLLNNLFGYGLGTLLPGFVTGVMQWGDEAGFRVTLLSSYIGFVFTFLATLTARKNFISSRQIPTYPQPVMS